MLGRVVFDLVSSPERNVEVTAVSVLIDVQLHSWTRLCGDSCHGRLFILHVTVTVHLLFHFKRHSTRSELTWRYRLSLSRFTCFISNGIALGRSWRGGIGCHCHGSLVVSFQMALRAMQHQLHWVGADVELSAVAVVLQDSRLLYYLIREITTWLNIMM